MRRIGSVLFILVCFLAIPPDRVSACYCVSNAPPSDELARSELVFAGKVLALDIPNTGPYLSSADPVSVTFQMSRVWKGAATRAVVVSTVRSTASCGYEFQEGAEYLVYAGGTVDNPRVSYCSRTRPLSAAGEDQQALGTGTVVAPENPLPDSYTLVALAGAAAVLIAAGLTLVRQARRISGARGS